MKIIQTVYNHADFQSSVMEYNGSWSTFISMLYMALNTNKTLEDEDCIHSRTPIDFGILLPKFRHYLTIQIDEYHLMIEGVREDENFQTIYMFIDWRISMKAKRYCMGSEDHYGCIHRTKDGKCTAEIGICQGQSIVPKCNPLSIPETASCKATNICVDTCDDTTISQIIEEMNETLTIQCERIMLEQRSIGIKIDVPSNFQDIENIIINGVKYKKETKF